MHTQMARMDGEKILMYLTAISTLIFQALAAETQEWKPEYMQVFEKHQTWEGYYKYNGTDNYCMLFIHSEHYMKKNGLLATFKDRNGATIEMEGEGSKSSELQVTFTVHLMFHDGNRFPGNFSFRATLYQKNDLWNIEADVMFPTNSFFSTIEMHQTDDNVGPNFDYGPQSWHYALIIGVPVVLAVIGIVGTVGILYWAIKRGYIRHVSKNYDNFHNPVQFDANSERVHM